MYTHRAPPTPLPLSDGIHSDWVMRLTHSGSVTSQGLRWGEERKGGWGRENKRGRESKNNSKMEEGFLFKKKNSLLLFVIFSVLLVSMSAAWTQGREGGSSRERKCLSADGSPWLLLGLRCQLLFCHSMHLTGK